MKNSMIVVALFGALTLGLYVTAGGQAGGEVAPTKVAVVNLQEVINECSQQAAFRAENTAKADSLRAEQEQRQREIQSITTAIDPLQPGSDAWENKRQELRQKTLELQVWVQMQEQDSQLAQARQFAEIYVAASDAAAAIAEQAGYDVVLQGGDLPDLMRLNIQQLQTVVQTRKVIYSSDSVDITNAVLQRVNSEFDQR
ncbi:MAG: OmpH family outer membrane protein [Planctomycetota bacterium]